jgi:hypothetical protein
LKSAQMGLGLNVVFQLFRAYVHLVPLERCSVTRQFYMLTYTVSPLGMTSGLTRTTVRMMALTLTSRDHSGLTWIFVGACVAVIERHIWRQYGILIDDTFPLRDRSCRHFLTSRGDI